VETALFSQRALRSLRASGISEYSCRAMPRFVGNYDWQEGDVPSDDDIVQWLVLFEYIAFTTCGNCFLQGCFRGAPKSVRHTLFPYFLRKLYPFYRFDDITGTEHDETWFLPVEARLLFFGNTPFFAKDVPFMHDTAISRQRQDSGDFEVDFSRAAGVDMLVPEGFASRHSLRMSKFGERGPQILIPRAENRLREQFEMRMEQQKTALAKTAVTILEPPLSVNIEPTIVEANAILPIQKGLPLSSSILPSNDILRDMTTRLSCFRNDAGDTWTGRNGNGVQNFQTRA
jgi:hypothetical protein